MTQFDSRICGIPCIIDVIYSTKYVPASANGHPDRSTPAEGGDFEYTVLTTKGKPAPWLQSKVTDEIDAQVYEEYLTYNNSSRD